MNFTTFFSFLSLVLDLYGKFEQTEKKVMYKYDDIGDSSALL